MDLVDFLRARLARDEQIARACAGAPWTASPNGVVKVDAAAGDQAWGDLGFVASVENAAYGEHIARQDPARTLQEVAAKRQVIDQYEKEAWMLGHGQRTTERLKGGQAALEAVLRLLALPYAHHPEYREDWRP